MFTICFTLRQILGVKDVNRSLSPSRDCMLHRAATQSETRVTKISHYALPRCVATYNSTSS